MRWFAIPLTLYAGAALAQEAEAPASSGTPMGANIRYRYMFVPKAITDTWYFDSDDAGAQAFDRPKTSTHVVGLEYAIEPAPASFLIYAEYWKVNMDEGYWDDKEDPPQHTDGDWLAPHNLGAVAFGVDFGHEFPVTDTASDVWVGFRMGGGLGLAIPTGRIDQWHAGKTFATDPTNDCLPNAFAWDRYSSCPADETLKVPPVLPVIDMDLGWRFHFYDTGILRIDAGIHDMFYFGVGAGAVF